MKIFAVLNEDGKLIGKREAKANEKPKALEVAVDPGALPLDGSLTYNEKDKIFTKKVSVLNKSGQLIGGRDAEASETLQAQEVAVDFGDLPADGSYKFDKNKNCFVPLGHGMNRVSSRPPLSESLALYHVIRALGDNVSPRSRDWADWYESNLKQRDEELIQLKKIRGKKS